MPHILVIDDDRTTRLLLSRTLEKQGYSVSEAVDGEAGLALAQEKQPAVIICDWMMPNMSGIEVCEQLKQDPHLKSTFFILLTSRSDIRDRVKGLEAGADEFLLKPIDPEELKARVQAGLRLYEALQTEQLLNFDLQTLNADLAAEKKILEDEWAAGAKYVRSMLEEPLTTPVAIGYQFLPSTQLGGDCFDYYWDETQTTLVIYLLDVSGHGLKSAFASLQILKLLRSRGLPQVDFLQPAQVLHALNHLFQMDENDQQYFTMWYGVYHRREGILDYASAGHPPALMVSTGTSNSVVIEELKTPGLPIGWFPSSTYQSQRCPVRENSLLYIYSDGIYEIPKADDSIWGVPALIELLETLHQAPNVSLSAIIEAIQDLFPEHNFTDDRALLRLKFPPRARM